MHFFAIGLGLCARNLLTNIQYATNVCTKLRENQIGLWSILRYALLPKAYDQQIGIDFTRIDFNSIVKSYTIHTILALAVKFNWRIRQLDMSNVFLHGYLDEVIYMEQPLEFIDATHPDYVCCLYKVLYGLKQA